MPHRVAVSACLAASLPLVLLAAPMGTHALGAEVAMSLMSPLERQVAQRGAGESAGVPLSGSVSVAAEVIEAKAKSVSGATQGKAAAWTVIAKAGDMKDGKFAGTLTLPSGGWHQLLVRARGGGQTVAEARGNRLILRFQTMDNEPLKLTGTPVGFVVAGEDRKFYEAQAELVDKTSVAVWSDKVPKPAEARLGRASVHQPMDGERTSGEPVPHG